MPLANGRGAGAVPRPVMTSFSGRQAQPTNRASRRVNPKGGRIGWDALKAHGSWLTTRTNGRYATRETALMFPVVMRRRRAEG